MSKASIEQWNQAASAFANEPKSYADPGKNEEIPLFFFAEYRKAREMF